MIAGRYDLVRELGRGGMGAVWLGRDTLLGREVALKRIGLLPGADARDLERAAREARLAARLNDPHVVAVYDLVEDGEQTWLVMEYVDGITVSAFVKRDGALTPDEAAPLIRQAAAALSAAHGAGIIHRDVKPSNMMVNAAGEVKLTDFGIARAEADASLTLTGLVTGSPAYLAPEVASGETATEAADVWSLGATLFHVLAGHPPYDVSDNVMGALYRIVHEEPPRLENAGWLAPLLEHTMTREPADRWSMSQVGDFLDHGQDVALQAAPLGAVDTHRTRTLESTPSESMRVPPAVVDPHPTPASRSAVPRAPGRTRRSRRPLLAALAVLLVAALVGGAGYVGSRLSHSSTPSSGSPGSSGRSSSGVANAASMDTFVKTYLSAVTQDRQRSWEMLTPSFQAQSGGLSKYARFWEKMRQATPRDILSDPATMTVTYDVDYVNQDRQRWSDHVTLRLVADGSSYLINGES